MRSLLIAAILLVASACNAAGQAAPWNDAPPNASGQTPAFANQTRAPALHSAFQIDEQVIASGLQHAWALALLPDGRFLVTERPGRLRILTPQGVLSAPLGGLPGVYANGQGGLFDVTLSPDFAHNRLIYWSYAEPRELFGAINGTAVARGRLSADEKRVENVQVVFRQTPPWRSRQHYGSRIVFDGQGHLFVTLGERNTEESRQGAQRLDNDFGKIVRLNPDGSIPADNPFVRRVGARPEIWSYGHRNVQAADINPATGALWSVEHGAQGGDEVNVPRAGRNYGWPIITYGQDYSGKPIGAGITQHEGMEQPVYYWDPVIAPGGAHFYRGDLFAGWRGDLLVGGLRGQALVRLKLDGERVVGEERLATDIGRIRAIAEDASGAIWIATDDENNSRVIRLTPKR